MYEVDSIRPPKDERTQKLPFHRDTAFSLRTVVAGAIVVTALAFALGLLVGTNRGGAAGGLLDGGAQAPAGVDFSPVWKAWQIINDQFVPVPVASSTPVVASSTVSSDQERVWGMIQGLAESLNDPYTYFLPPVENKQFTQDMSGAFDGVGMEIAVKNQVLTVVSPLKGTPAERAGIKPGDQILKIDELDTRGMDINTAVSHIRGPKGTQVALLVFREGWEAPREIKVTRDVINVPTLTTTARADGIFVIQLYTFTANSPDLFRNALREFVQSGDAKLILDLRGNPGGYLEAAVDMASWFLPSGKIVVTEDYDGHGDNIAHRSFGYDVFNENLKMVVLVDRGSASAAEILAGALRHYGIAKLVGVNTFGKGSVQELVDITSDTSLKITVARWLGPDGTHIPVEGIAPDVNVPLTEADAKAEKDPQLEKAVELLGGSASAIGTPAVE